MQEHPVVELYITINDSEQNTIIEQLLASVNIDEVALPNTAYSWHHPTDYANVTHY